MALFELLQFSMHIWSWLHKATPKLAYVFISQLLPYQVFVVLWLSDLTSTQKVPSSITGGNFFTFFCFGQFSVINLLKNVSHVFSSQKSQLAIKNAAKIDNNWQKGIINNQFFHLNLPFALCVTREQCGSTEDHCCHVFSL